MWETTVRPGSGQYFFHGDPLITSDLVIVGADAGGAAGVTASIHAFERSTGRQRWTYSAGHGVASATSGLGRSAYAIRLEGEMLSLDVDTGTRRWSFPVDVWGWLAPAAAPGRVFVGVRDGSLYALNAETGRVEWQTNLGAPVTTSVTVGATGLFVGTADGTVSRVDSQRGSVIASRKLDETLRPRSVPVTAGRSLLVLLADASEYYRALVSLDETLASVRWRQNATKAWNTSRVFVWRQAAVVGTSAGEVVAYCTADGSIAWSRTVRGPVRAIGGSDDTLYVGTSDGNLYALAPVTSSCDAK